MGHRRLAPIKTSAPERRREDAISHLPLRSAGNAVLARLLVPPRPAEPDPTALASELQAARSGGSSLPPAVASRLEPHIGPAADAIRVHTDSRADTLARSVDAVAFTTGRDIFFRSGAYQPGSRSGLQLLAHEGTHVAQQAAGPVSGTPIGGGLAVSDPSDRYEREAHRQASRVT
ncbi:MAG TPA: DUF4157 domain-containing protein [Acidimicrobiales bacterium]|nr:DUF4157 domain-containing protein [Acidimicrobiales bacterium]